MILRLAEGLDPFPVGRGGGVDMETHRGGPHIGDPPDVGMLQEQFRLVAAAGDEVHDPLGHARLDQEFQDPHGRLGRQAGRLQDKGIAQRDAQGVSSSRRESSPES